MLMYCEGSLFTVQIKGGLQMNERSAIQVSPLKFTGYSIEIYVQLCQFNISWNLSTYFGTCSKRMGVSLIIWKILFLRAQKIPSGRV